eukprot:gene19141-19507_t
MTDETIVTPTYITLGEAAKRTGLSKATISRMLKSGRISAKEKGEDGAFRIDPAEIIRFMDAARLQRATVQRKDEVTNLTPSKDAVSSDETDFETRLRGLRDRDAIEMRAMLAEERLADLKAQLDTMRQQRDSWQQQAERALLMLQPPSDPTPQRRGLFGWLRRSG